MIKLLLIFFVPLIIMGAIGVLGYLEGLPWVWGIAATLAVIWIALAVLLLKGMNVQ